MGGLGGYCVGTSRQDFAIIGLSIKRSLEARGNNFVGRPARRDVGSARSEVHGSPRSADRLMAWGRLVENDLASRSLEVDGNGAQFRKRMAYRLVPILGSEKGEETTGAGAQNLAPDGAMLSRRLVPIVDVRGGNPMRHVALEHPGLVQNLAERIQIVVPDLVQKLIAERNHSLHRGFLVNIGRQLL